MTSSNYMGLLQPNRWVHNGMSRINVLLTDGHVMTVAKTDVVGVQVTNPWTCWLFYAR
jgi:prepilin-type processing-associated H-X9-DG protein